VLSARFARLAPPFLFGTLVLIPPQSWAEAFGKGSFDGNMGQWWLREFSPAGIADGIPINHLWFVLYIGVYSLAAIALLAKPSLLARLEAVLDGALAGWRVLVLPILYLAIVRQLLFPWFGLTNRLPVDWYNHASSLAVFLLGFTLVSRDGFWRQLERLRWIAAAAALVSVVLLMGLHVHPEGRMLWGSLRNGAFAINQWSTVAAVLGFGSLHLRSADGPLRRYLNDAIFPCYLAHQTLLVMAVFFLAPLKLPALPEALLFIGLTFGGSLAVYEVVRRIGFIRPLWGLKPFPPVGTETDRPSRLTRTMARALGPEPRLLTTAHGVQISPANLPSQYAGHVERSSVIPSSASAFSKPRSSLEHSRARRLRSIRSSFSSTAIWIAWLRLGKTAFFTN
jgi:hypothetical protein